MGLSESAKLFYRDASNAALERGWRLPIGVFRLVLKYFLNYLMCLCAQASPSKFTPFFHKIRGVKVGRDVFIDRSVIIDEAYPENIEIDDEVRIGAGTVIISHSKAGMHLRTHYLPNRVAKVKICKYAFIGVNAVIMPGVTIGEGSVVVCGSVVMTNVKPYTVVSGIPAKKISELERF